MVNGHEPDWAGWLEPEGGLADRFEKDLRGCRLSKDWVVGQHVASTSESDVRIACGPLSLGGKGGGSDF